MNWEDILKEDDWRKRLADHKKKYPFVRSYKYGRCLVGNGTRCIRNLQSPERREYAGSYPQGKTCMYCEDDASKWADLPHQIFISKEWKEADAQKKKAILDDWVKQNKEYNHSNYEPSYY